MLILYSEKKVGCFRLALSLYNIKNCYYFKAVLYEGCNINESCTTMPVTDNYCRAKEIFDILTENAVFPCHLYNVIDELI